MKFKVFLFESVQYYKYHIIGWVLSPKRRVQVNNNQEKLKKPKTKPNMYMSNLVQYILNSSLQYAFISCGQTTLKTSLCMFADGLLTDYSKLQNWAITKELLKT